eukprot:CAMPEP_0201951492 /NCGR_PEP_ID=MMETSP0904-20121228/411_1 /ASSEMBLY_ACC=CAM_ASM_000553 /TAXON_ID=420261 /ORGANISM="Thalassiosira antarctica, Strain CCMP982" /LENGTH=111 /DNA_ID=CAMNT_0048494889 /DNA_START=577 /DNA_END=912 /DNA_ORIENTATION=-
MNLVPFESRPCDEPSVKPHWTSFSRPSSTSSGHVPAGAGTKQKPTLGSMVVKGWGAMDAPPSIIPLSSSSSTALSSHRTSPPSSPRWRANAVAALKRVDLPADGFPTRPTV